MSSQQINTETLRFKRAAFYNGLKSKVGLAAREPFLAQPRRRAPFAQLVKRQVTGPEIFTRLRPGASKKKVNQTTKPKGSRNQLCLPHKAQPGTKTQGSQADLCEFLDCSKCADNIKTERSIFARRRLAGHTATIEINVIQVKHKQS